MNDWVKMTAQIKAQIHLLVIKEWKQEVNDQIHSSMDQRISQWERLAHLKTRHCSLGFWTQKKVKICTVPDRPSLNELYGNFVWFREDTAPTLPPDPISPSMESNLVPLFPSVCVVRAPTMALGFGAKMLHGSAIVVDRGRWPQFPHQHHGGPPAPSSCRQARDCSCSKLPCWVEVSALLIWNVLERLGPPG